MLIIKNGRIVTPSGIYEGEIVAENDTIVSIEKNASLPKGARLIDAAGKYILPGMIDAHSHMHEPDVSKTDFINGTTAAAAGGWTTLLEMPISIPGVWNREILENRAAIGESKCLVDFGLFGGGGIDNLDRIAEMADSGAIGFKTFMNQPLESRAEEFIGLWAATTGQQFQVMREIVKTGLPNVIHAEDADLIDILTAELKEAGRKDPQAYIESRPNITETLAVSRVRLLAAEIGARVHICHMHSREGVAIIADAKSKGEKMTAETCPHYLVLTAADMTRFGGPYGTNVKCAPPVGTPEDVDRLWEGLRDGTIDCIATDHSPFPREQKETNIWDAAGGIPGFQTALPLLLTEVNNGRISLPQLVRVTSENVARLFGLFPRKGVIQVGADADFVIIDLEKEDTIRKEQLHTRGVDAVPYLGWKVKAMPTHTIVRGELVMQEGEVCGQPGHGIFIRPEVPAS